MDYICSVKYGAFFTIARPFLDTRNFFQDFFGSSVFLKMKLTPKALRGLFWAFGVFDHSPSVSILLRLL